MAIAISQILKVDARCTQLGPTYELVAIVLAFHKKFYVTHHNRQDFFLTMRRVIKDVQDVGNSLSSKTFEHSMVL